MWVCIMVLFVIYDIDEVLYLVDRVLVMSFCLGWIIVDLVLDFLCLCDIWLVISVDFVCLKCYCLELFDYDDGC